MTLDPVRKDHNCSILHAEGCSDLPVTKSDDAIYSIWKCTSLWKRLVFLFTGEITLGVMTKSTQPPVCLLMGDYVQQELDKQ